MIARKSLFGGIAGLPVLSALLLCTGILNAQEDKPVPVKITRAVSAPVYEELPLTGTVDTRRLSRLSPREDGLVSVLHADEGDEVRQGDLLLQLDNELAGIDRSRIAAQAREAQARLKESVRQRDEAAELVKKRHIPATNYEAALADVEMSEAILERLQQEQARQESIVARHSVYAPFNGVITQKFVELGEWVKTDTALFELTEIDVVRVNTPVPQHYFNRIGSDTLARIRFDAYPGRDFTGQVKIRIPMGNEATRTFPVMIELDNNARLLAPGMSARVIFQIGDANRTQAVLLPNDAIVRKPDGSERIWIVTEHGNSTRASEIKVKTGRQFRNNVEIVSGDLQQGDRVVIRGNEQLLPGQNISIIEEVKLQVN